MGRTYLTGAPGKYLHASENRSKSEWTYMPFVDLGDNGINYAVLLEALVDRNQHVVPHWRTDQWIQKPGSVVLSALWVKACHWTELQVCACVADAGRSQALAIQGSAPALERNCEGAGCRCCSA